MSSHNGIAQPDVVLPTITPGDMNIAPKINDALRRLDARITNVYNSPVPDVISGDLGTGDVEVAWTAYLGHGWYLWTLGPAHFSDASTSKALELIDASGATFPMFYCDEIVIKHTTAFNPSSGDYTITPSFDAQILSGLLVSAAPSLSGVVYVVSPPGLIPSSGSGYPYDRFGLLAETTAVNLDTVNAGVVHVWAHIIKLPDPTA